MSDQDLKETVAGLVVSTAELQREVEKLRRAQTETGQVLQDWIAGQQQTDDKWLTELIELSDERVKLVAMDRLLFGRLGMRDISQSASASNNDGTLVIGVLACDNVERKEVIIVEERSELTATDIEELLEKIEQFPYFFRLYRDCKIYGLLAAREISAELRNEVLRQGLYLARTGRRTFKLQVPRGFKAKAFGPASKTATAEQKEGGTAARPRRVKRNRKAGENL